MNGGRAGRMPRQRRRSPRGARRIGRSDPLRARQVAISRLRKYRQGSLLVVSLTALLLFAWSGDAPTDAATRVADGTPAAISTVTADGTSGRFESIGDATTIAYDTIRHLVEGLVRMAPRVALAALVVFAGGMLARLVARTIRRAARSWQRGEGVAAVASVGIWLLAVGAALSVVAGDARALVGSVGLTGLALSWALQTPIESFTGWLLNSFKGYYRVGDRIGVGDVFGDVFRIDVLTTTVWEAGAPGKPVQAAQPTGALITFPNNEVLRSNIVNYTRDFPYVWDEVTIGITNDSDVDLAIELARVAAGRTVGEAMRGPALQYATLLHAAGLTQEITDHPEVYVAPTDSWTNLVVRYLVPARERRLRSSELVLAIGREFARPEHGGRVRSAYPRLDVDIQSSGG